MLLPWRHPSVGGCNSLHFLTCVCRRGQTTQPVYWSLLTWLGGWWAASQLLFGRCLSREEAALDCEEQTLPRGREGAPLKELRSCRNSRCKIMTVSLTVRFLRKASEHWWLRDFRQFLPQHFSRWHQELRAREGTYSSLPLP